MLLKDGNAYKNVLLRGLTSLLDPVKKKAISVARLSLSLSLCCCGCCARSCRKQTSSAVKPPAGADAGTGGPCTGARPAVAAVGPGASASPAAAAVSACLQVLLLLLLVLVLVLALLLPLSL